MSLEGAVKQLEQKLDAGAASKEDRAAMWLKAAIVVGRSILTVRGLSCSTRPYLRSVAHIAACIMPVCSVTGSADGISRHHSAHVTLPVVHVCLDTSVCRPGAG